MKETELVSPLQRSIHAASSQGERLRHARELRGWSQQEVATMLCLNTRIVAALEQDNPDAIGAPVFVRGYLRNYVQLLRLPFNEFCLEEVANTQPVNAVAVKKTSLWRQAMGLLGYLFLRFLNYGMVFLVAWLVFIWWHNRYHANNQPETLPELLKMSVYQDPFPRIDFTASIVNGQKPLAPMTGDSAEASTLWQQIDPQLLIVRNSTHG